MSVEVAKSGSVGRALWMGILGAILGALCGIILLTAVVYGLALVLALVKFVIPSSSDLVLHAGDFVGSLDEGALTRIAGQVGAALGLMRGGWIGLRGGRFWKL